MDLYEAMRTTPSCRYFTDEPVSDEALHRIFDHARFASSGGNRQGWRTVVVTQPGALVAVGWPVPERQYTKLTRKSVSEVVFRDHFGSPFTQS